MNPDLKDKIALFGTLESLRDTEDDDEVVASEETEHRAKCKAYARLALKRPGIKLRSTFGGIGNSLGVAHRRTASDSIVTSPKQPTNGRPEVIVIEDTPQQLPRRLPPSQHRVTSVSGSAFHVENTSDSTRKSASQPGILVVQPQSERAVCSSPPPVEDSPTTNMAKRKRPDKPQWFKGMSFFYYPNNDTNAVRKHRINTAREHGATWVRDLDEATHVIVDADLKYADMEMILAESPGSTDKIVINDRWPGECIGSKMILNTALELYRVPGHPKISKKAEGAQHLSQDNSLKLKEPTSRPRRNHVVSTTTPSRSYNSTQISTQTSSDQAISESRLGGPGPAIASVEETILCADGNEPTKLATSVAEKSTQNSVEYEFSQLIKYCKENPEAGVDGYGEVGVEVNQPPLPVGPVATAPPTWDGNELSSEEERKQRKKSKTKSARSKNENWQDNFACMKGGHLGDDSNNPNAKAISILQQLADHWDRHKTCDEESFRINNYRKAVHSLRQRTTIITTAEEAREISGIGGKIADKIVEIAKNGRCRELEELQKDPNNAVRELFLNVYGVGHTTASDWISQGLRTLQEVLEKAKPTKYQRLGIEHFDDLNTRIPRVEVEALGVCVMRTARGIDPLVEFIVGGSYRRGQMTSGDIDFIVTRKGTKTTADLDPFFRKLIERLTDKGFLTAGLATSRSEDGNKWHGCCVLPESDFPGNKAGYKPIWRRIDFLLVPETELGAAMIYFTGNDLLNRSIRLLANKKGFNLSHKGLFQGVIRDSHRKKTNDGVLVEARDERKIWDILGVPWLEPHERNI
ncbi:hypothetical protein TruAng_007884 [Truncatella angustata]|nr:hypothetical protein TruAng_007884 [Truncatella angustata]